MGRQAAEGLQALRRAAQHRGRPVRPRRGGLPGRRRAQPDDELVLPLPLHAARGSRDDGEGPEPRRHAAGLRHDDRRADRPDGLHGQGRRDVRAHHARRGAARPAALQHGRRRPGRPPELPAALRDRARPRDQVVADDRLRAVPGRDLGLERRADLRPRRRRRGEGPGARPPDGRAPRRVPDARPDRHLGDARQGLARGGEARGARRPRWPSRSSCSSSTASSGSSRSSA